jgi:hypothetical protein
VAFERCHDPEELQRLMGGSGGAAAYPDGGGALSMGSMSMGGDSYA